MRRRPLARQVSVLAIAISTLLLVNCGGISIPLIGQTPNENKLTLDTSIDRSCADLPLPPEDGFEGVVVRDFMQTLGEQYDDCRKLAAALRETAIRLSKR